LVKRKPTGSWASCGIEKLSISRSRNWKEAPVSKICHEGLQERVFWIALAVGAFAKNLRRGKRFRLSIPEEWSPCSWVTKTASIRSIDSPRGASSPASFLAEKPASSRMRAPSVMIRALLPELPLPRMQNLITKEHFLRHGEPSAMVIPSTS